VAHKGQYFIVRKGTELREDFSNVKFTQTRVFSGIDACEQTFGKVTRDMFVKLLGSQKTLRMPFKKKLQIMRDPEGWIPMSDMVEIANI